MVDRINGNAFAEPRTEKEADEALDNPPMTLGYRARMPMVNLWNRNGGGFVSSCLMDVEEMLSYQVVVNSYDYYKAGISAVKFTVKAQSSKIGEFVHKTLSHFWEKSLAQAQHVYDYGWLGCEINYKTENGIRHFHSLHDLHPFDTMAVTKRKIYAGFEVGMGLSSFLGDVNGAATGNILLWGPKAWPAKGLWLTHKRRYNRFYGRSQLYGAWKPWRRLATRDGADEVVDGGFYRGAWQGPLMRYPKGASMKSDGSTSYDSNRETARQMTQEVKAGASIALPSDYNKDTGQFLWSLEWAKTGVVTSDMIAYLEHLQKQVSIGIGVPPELIEASQTGSGYSGREIPLMGFLSSQLGNARNFVSAVDWQIAKPLVRWNFGPGHNYEIITELAPQKRLGGGDQQPQEQQGDPTGGMGGGQQGQQGEQYRGPRGGSGVKDINGKVRYM